MPLLCVPPLFACSRSFVYAIYSLIFMYDVETSLRAGRQLIGIVPALHNEIFTRKTLNDR